MQAQLWQRVLRMRMIALLLLSLLASVVLVGCQDQPRGENPWVSIDLVVGNVQSWGFNDHPDGSLARFNGILDLAVAASGIVYIADFWNKSVQYHVFLPSQSQTALK